MGQALFTTLRLTATREFTTPGITSRPVIGANVFVGTYGYNSVLRMPVAGSTPRPFVTDYPSPIIAVGGSRGELYAATLAGTIYRVKPCRLMYGLSFERCREPGRT